ncbi:MAG: ABC-F family ATP-binding cassette domain-containing protein [Vicinamibacterales bacterium]
MIQLSGVTKAFGDRVLLDNVTWQITRRERVGLCGPNGAGKTTLLKMFAGLEEPDTGLITKPASLTIGYLPQDGIVHQGRTVFGEASSAFADLLAIKAEIGHLEARLGDPDEPDSAHEELLSRYAELQEAFRAREGYSVDLKVATVLRGLGFSPADFERPTETFSGGWQMRIALAKLLLLRPNLLLLDEPTNHLDLDARNWLEEYLVDYPDAVILVSHDHYFLDAVVTRVADLSLRTITDYVGNYTRYLAEHDARIERLRQQKRDQDEEVARMKMFIDRFRYQATKAAQVQSRIKMLEKVVPIEVPPERKRVHFTFPQCAKSGRTVLELKHVRKAYGANVVFAGIDVHIERGDRLALIGANGNGKSTLMRMLSGVEAPDAGTRTEGHQVVIQYFAQDEAARLDPELTVHDTLAEGSPVHMVPMIRNILGGFLFSGDDIHKPVRVLSGGERTRLAVARMLLRPANTLLLDEPTNHLDIDSKNVLLDALEDFGGTLVLVSHDRYFIDKLATKVVDVGGGEALVYPGGYEEFRWKQANAAQAAQATPRAVPTPPAKATPPPRPAGAATATAPRPPAKPVHAPTTGRAAVSGNGHRPDVGRAADHSRDDRKRHEAEQRRRKRAADAIKSKVDELEARIADREQQLKTLEATMAAPGFYDHHETSKPVLDQHQALMWEVGDLMHRWEELQAEAAAAESQIGRPQPDS